MFTYLILPIALAGLTAALSDISWGAALVLVAALFGRALDGHHIIPDSMVAETAALLTAFWGIGGYLRTRRALPLSLPYLPLLGAGVGALVGVMIFGGVAFAPLSILGAMLTSAVAASLRRPETRVFVLVPLRILSVMVAAYWLMFHLT